MTKQWDINVNGNNHTIKFKRGSFSSNLFIDNEPVNKLKSKNFAIVLIDYPFQIEDKKFNLVVIGNKADLAQDGIYIDSGEKYISVDNAPSWVNGLSIALFVIGLVLNGLIGACISIVGIVLCVKAGLKKNTQSCIIISVITIAIEIILKIIIIRLFMLS